MAKDLVCNMDVDEKTAKYKTLYKGKYYYFCAPGCKKAFEANPQKYISGGAVHLCLALVAVDVEGIKRLTRYFFFLLSKVNLQLLWRCPIAGHKPSSFLLRKSLIFVLEILCY